MSNLLVAQLGCCLRRTVVSSRPGSGTPHAVATSQADAAFRSFPPPPHLHWTSAHLSGNTVVYSVDPAGATTTLETIEAGAVPVTTSAAPGVGGGQDAGRVTGTEASVNLGQQTAPASTGSTRPPTTYLAYSTNAGGEQITLSASTGLVHLSALGRLADAPVFPSAQRKRSHPSRSCRRARPRPRSLARFSTTRPTFPCRQTLQA